MRTAIFSGLGLAALMSGALFFGLKYVQQQNRGATQPSSSSATCQTDGTTLHCRTDKLKTLGLGELAPPEITLAIPAPKNLAPDEAYGPPAGNDPPEVIKIERFSPALMNALVQSLELDELTKGPELNKNQREQNDRAETIINLFPDATPAAARAKGDVPVMPRCSEDRAGTLFMPYAQDGSPVMPAANDEANSR